MSLYHECKCLAIFENEYTQKKDEYFSKLQIINPEFAKICVDAEKSANEYSEKIKRDITGNGCLVMILTFLLVTIIWLIIGG